MRYYRVVVRDRMGGPVARLAGGKPFEWTSWNGKRTDPGALDIEIDMNVRYFASPLAGSYVRIWGIDIATISQAADLNGKFIEIYGGMQKGLPLADPKQAGLLAMGTIQQAFSNWIGVDMTLDMYFTAGNTLPDAPFVLSFNWRAGTPMADTIIAALKTKFPEPMFSYTSRVSPRLVMQTDQPGYYFSMLQFSKAANEISRGIIRDAGYAGVQIMLKATEFIISDGTVQRQPKPIRYTDLIGQVTWLGVAQVSITTVMRYDIEPGDLVTLPPRQQFITVQQSQSQARPRDTFKGQFVINSVRHVGRLRSPQSQSWVTVFDAASMGQPANVR
jgi:hypothetical protein